MVNHLGPDQGCIMYRKNSKDSVDIKVPDRELIPLLKSAESVEITAQRKEEFHISIAVIHILSHSEIPCTVLPHDGSVSLRSRARRYPNDSFP